MHIFGRGRSCTKVIIQNIDLSLVVYDEYQARKIDLAEISAPTS